MNDLLKKSVKLTAAQHQAAKYVVGIASDLLHKADPTDTDTPLEITIGEVFEVAGSKLIGLKAGN